MLWRAVEHLLVFLALLVAAAGALGLMIAAADCMNRI